MEDAPCRLGGTGRKTPGECPLLSPPLDPLFTSLGPSLEAHDPDQNKNEQERVSGSKRCEPQFFQLLTRSSPAGKARVSHGAEKCSLCSPWEHTPGSGTSTDLSGSWLPPGPSSPHTAPRVHVFVSSCSVPERGRHGEATLGLSFGGRMSRGPEAIR